MQCNQLRFATQLSSRSAAKPISSQFESPAMSSGEGETVEGATINPVKLPICGGVPLCEKEEARALH